MSHPCVVTLDSRSAPAHALLRRSARRRRSARPGTRVVYPKPPLERAEGRRRRDPLRDQPPVQLGAALREAPPGDEGHHRDRRHLAAAPADEPARRARARAHDRARSARRSRRRRRRDHHRDERPPAHEGLGGPPRRRRQDLQRLLAEEALQPRRREPREHEVHRHDGARRGGRAQQARRRQRPRHLREPEPRAHGRRAQVGRRRPLRLPEPPRAPQPEGDARLPLVHGSDELGARHERRAHGAARQQEAQRLHHRDDDQQPHVRSPARVPRQERGRPHRAPRRTRSARSASRSTSCRSRRARRSSSACPSPFGVTGVFAGETEAVHAHTLQALLRAVPRPGHGAGRHPDHGHPVHQPVQRELVPEPAARAGDGERLPVQPLQGRARW